MAKTGNNSFEEKMADCAAIPKLQMDKEAGLN